MPLFLHIWCECGHVGKIEVSLHDNHHAVFRKARCSICRSTGYRGIPVDAVLGWGHECNLEGEVEVLRGRTPDSR